MAKLKYIDYRKIRFPKLVNYKNGVYLPNEDNIIEVTEHEKNALLKRKNGINPCFEEVKKIKKKEAEPINIGEVDGGDL